MSRELVESDIMATANSNSAGLIKINNMIYVVTQVNGQRVMKLQDEPAQPAPNGSEIFIGNLPRYFNEHDLMMLFIQTGPIYKLRLMMDFYGLNRGYAFVKYFMPESARAAIGMFHRYKMSDGSKLAVHKSVDNCRLFVGNLPRTVTKKMIYEEFAPYAEGLNNVILYPSWKNQKLNRGFAFLEFADNRCAAIARRKLAPDSFVVWNRNVLVDWAEPIPEVEPEIMATVSSILRICMGILCFTQCLMQMK